MGHCFLICVGIYLICWHFSWDIGIDLVEYGGVVVA